MVKCFKVPGELWGIAFYMEQVGTQGGGECDKVRVRSRRLLTANSVGTITGAMFSLENAWESNV